MSDKDKGNLHAALDAAQKILLYTEGISDTDSFYADARTFDAVLMNFVVIGESVARLSDLILESNPDVPWRQVKGFRNVIAHDYFGVDAEETWQVIQKHIPKFIEDLMLIG